MSVTIRVVLRTAILVALIGVSALAVAAPNLTPYRPSGWSDKIVVSTVPGTTSDSSPLTPESTLYIHWAVTNNGSTSTGVRYYTSLFVDGSFWTSWYTDPPHAAGYYVYVVDYALGSLPAGTHTIAIVADSTGLIAESNESDNQYTKTITVASGANLAPYRPSGWSDAIVVSTGVGTHTDSSSLSTTDTLYVDWAVGNSGFTATTATFYTQLYVDDVLWAYWYTDPPLNAGYYTWVDDYSIGSLPAGLHTLKLVADAYGTIGETNESDNVRTKVIDVGSVNLTPYRPSAWSDKIVVSNVAGTTTDSATITPGDNVYVDWAVINNGTGSTSSRFYSQLYVDGVPYSSWYTDPPLNPNDWAYVSDASLGTFAAGTHTLRIAADVTQAVPESNESDNEYSRTFVVTAVGSPDIRISPTSVSFSESATVEEYESAASIGTRHVDPAALSAIMEKAEQRPVRVLVGLTMPFSPEGRLDELRAARQRETIRRQQNDILAQVGTASSARVHRFETIPYLVMELTRDQIERLASLPATASIEEDVSMPPALASSNNVIHTATAWAAGITGAGQTVAVLDSGVDSLHPFFSTGTNKVVSEACYSSTTASSISVCPGGVSESTASGSGRDCLSTIAGCDHGTHVAGIVAGNDGAGPNFGVARGATLIAIQVFSRFNSSVDCSPSPAPCARTYTSDYIKGLERVYALRNSFSIAAVNMSLGSSTLYTSACDATYSSVKAAIDNLRSVGIATVIASGNDGSPNSMSAPACISSAISVGATTDSDAIASFSNVSSLMSLLAPGVSITSSVPGGSTGSKNGTSMATPHVAGAWALMKQAMPAADVTTILNKLRDTGVVLSDGRSGGIVSGMRRIDIGAAVTSGNGGQSFTIYNDGTATLNITSIVPATSAPWITWSPSAPFSIAPGSSRQVSVTVDKNSAPSGQSSTRLLVYSNDPDENPYPDGVNINVSGSSPVVSVSVTDSDAREAGSATGSLRISRSGSTSSSLAVAYALGGTASNGVDYNSLSGSITIPAGQTSASIVVVPVDDALLENAESVIVTLQAGSGYTVGSPNSGTVSIADNDASVSVTATDSSASEAGANRGTFTITRNGTTNGSLTVYYTVGGSASNGNDYDTLSGNVVIPSGAGSTTVNVVPHSDSAIEGTETVVITIASNANYRIGSPSSGTVYIGDAPPPSASARADFNRDGNSDLVWRSTTTGENYVWYLSGTTYAGAARLPAVKDQNWTLIGTADVNGDGYEDLAFHNTSTGQSFAWTMQGTSATAQITWPSAASPWRLLAIADFNANSKPDLVWRNLSTGQLVVWFMNGSTIQSSAWAPTVPLSSTYGGAGDFDGDGNTDMVWRDSSGQVAVWLLASNLGLRKVVRVGSVASPWLLAGIADINRDGALDILFRNPSTGQNAVWYVGRVTLTSAPFLGSAWLPALQGSWTLAAPR